MLFFSRKSLPCSELKLAHRKLLNKKKKYDTLFNYKTCCLIQKWYDDSSLEKGKKIVNYRNPCVFLWKAVQKKGR